MQESSPQELKHKEIARSFGGIYTPPEIASFLSHWAIKNKSDEILDLGVGEGVFALAAYQRLLTLGNLPERANQQIHGAEIRADAYQCFLRRQAEQRITLPNIQFGDFFNCAFPNVDAVIGNPPYVRRRHMEDVEHVRQTVLCAEEHKGICLTAQTDLYIYFLLRACTFLKKNGRLAVIVADSWLNVGYGKSFKKYLLENFCIQSIISPDERVFNADVKSVMLLATKMGEASKKNMVCFTRVANAICLDQVFSQLTNDKSDIPVIAHTKVEQGKLTPDFPWSIHLKASSLYEQIHTHKRLVPLSQIAKTRIGIQTLANDFFILSSDQVKERQIEEQYLKPLAYTPKLPLPSVLEEGINNHEFLFFCSEQKQNLADTQALRYIEEAEEAIVPVRGKGEVVTGYQNKLRIQQDRRANWYDMKSAVMKRECAEILLPRFVYRNYRVVWNKAMFVPQENFIEVFPLFEDSDETEVLLATLSSTFTELTIRLYSQVYGGGTYSISPGIVKSLPIINIHELSAIERNRLVNAYRSFISEQDGNRQVIDTVIYDILNFDLKTQTRMEKALEELVSLSSASKHQLYKQMRAGS